MTTESTLPRHPGLPRPFGRHGPLGRADVPGPLGAFGAVGLADLLGRHDAPEPRHPRRRWGVPVRWFGRGHRHGPGGMGTGTTLGSALLRVRRDLADPDASAAGDPNPDAAPAPDDFPSAATPPGGLTITDIYHAHRVELIRLAALLVDDPESAQDVVQDTFTAAYRRYGLRMTGIDDPLRYLRRGVVNGSRSLLRRRRTARAWVPPHVPPAPSPEEDAIRAEEDHELRAALDRLRPRQREVLVLRYFSGLSEADIARTLRVPQGTVKSTANRALKALHRMLEPGR